MSSNQSQQSQEPMLEAAAKSLKQAVFIKSSGAELESHAETILNDLCAGIQDRIGITTGDRAATFFSGSQGEFINDYILTEVRDKQEELLAGEDLTSEGEELVYLVSETTISGQKPHRPDIAGFPSQAALEILRGYGYRVSRNVRGYGFRVLGNGEQTILVTKEDRPLYLLPVFPGEVSEALVDFAKIEGNHLKALQAHNALAPNGGTSLYHVGSTPVQAEPLYSTISRFGHNLSQIVLKRIIPKMSPTQLHRLLELGDGAGSPIESVINGNVPLQNDQSIYALNLAHDCGWVVFAGDSLDAFKRLISLRHKEIDARISERSVPVYEGMAGGSNPEVVLDF